MALHSLTLLTLFSLLLIAFFFFLFLLLNNKLSSQSGPPPCPVGFCPTNIFNGVKRCPPGEEQLTPQGGLEVCNPRYSCLGITPYAQLSDGSTSSSGVCPTGVECPCLRVQFCPTYVTSTFQVVGISPYDRVDKSRAIVYQQAAYSNFLKEAVNGPPLALEGETSFCSIPSSWLGNIYPKTCLRGNLYYLTDHLESFNSSRDPLACVSAPECLEGRAVFERSTQKAYCLPG